MNGEYIPDRKNSNETIHFKTQNCYTITLPKVIFKTNLSLQLLTLKFMYYQFNLSEYFECARSCFDIH